MPTTTGLAPAELRSRWGWIVALGAVMLIAGVIALGSVLMATIVSVLIVGIMMMISGVFEIVHGFQMRSWGRFFFWIVLGILYLIAGFIAFRWPLLASSVFTLILAWFLVAAGIVRIVLGANMRTGTPWGWAVASGIITLVVGLIILFGWPASSLYALGIFLGVDLVFAGVAWLSIGFGLRSRAL